MFYNIGHKILWVSGTTCSVYVDRSSRVLTDVTPLSPPPLSLSVCLFLFLYLFLYWRENFFYLFYRDKLECFAQSAISTQA
jgi:hypothetical protein